MFVAVGATAKEKQTNRKLPFFCGSKVEACVPTFLRRNPEIPLVNMN